MEGMTLDFEEASELARFVGKARQWPDRGEGLASWLLSDEVRVYDLGEYTTPETWAKIADTIRRGWPESVYPGIGKLCAVYDRGQTVSAQTNASDNTALGAAQNFAGGVADTVEAGVAKAGDVAKAATAATGILARVFSSPLAWLVAGGAALVLGSRRRG